MTDRSRYSLPPLLGFHGCDRDLGEAVLAGEVRLTPSANSYDWLGPGIYFWVDSPQRGWEWAMAQSRRKGSPIKAPFVLGAFIYPGLCLNLTDYGVREQLVGAHAVLKKHYRNIKQPLPKNEKPQDRITLLRHLDCAVINTLHGLRDEAEEPPYDTVYGFFEEGRALYPHSALKQKKSRADRCPQPSQYSGLFPPQTFVVWCQPHPAQRSPGDRVQKTLV